MEPKSYRTLSSEEEVLELFLQFTKTYGKYSNDQIWTGFPSSKYLEKLLGKNTPSMNELSDLEKKIKSLILEHRKMSTKKELKDDMLKVSDDLEFYINQMYSKILALMKNKKNELILTYVMTFEELVKNNPSEFSKDKEMNAVFKQLKDSISEHNIIFTILKVAGEPNGKKRTVIELLGIEKMLNSLKNEESPKILRKFLRNTSGIKKMSIDEQKGILSPFCALLKLDDLYNFIENSKNKNEIFSVMLDSIFENYLLYLSYIDSQKPESERIYPELTEDYICSIPEKDIQKVAIEKYEYREWGEGSFNAELIADCIVEYADYLNMNNLFLTILARYIEFFEKSSVKSIKKDKNIEFGDTILSTPNGLVVVPQRIATEMIKAAKKEFNEVFNNSSVPEENVVDISNVLYTINKIKEEMKQFCGDFYLTPQLSSFIKYDIFIHDSDEYLRNKELLQRLNFRMSDIFLLATTSSKDLKALYDAKIIDDDYICMLTQEILINGDKKVSLEEMCKENDYKDNMIEEIIKKRKFQSSLEFLKGALENELLTLDDIKDLYVLGYVSDKLLDDLKLDTKEIEATVDRDEIADMYKTYAEHWCDGSNDIEAVKKEKDRLMSLFYKYASTYNQLSDAEKEEFGIDILQKIFLEDYDELEKEEKEKRIGKIMREMRSDGFINYRCIESAGLLKEYISEAMAEDELNFVDCSEIKNAVSSDDMKKIVEKILDEKRLDDSKKYALVMNLLDDYNDETINKFEFVKDSSSSTSNDENHRRRENNSDGKKSNGWLYTDKTKWKFYGALDKDFKPERCANGFVIIYSPKLQKRFIEKLYVIDRNSKPSGLDYGTATYVINEDDYQIIKDELIVKHEGSSKDIIDVANMRRNIPRQDRISHITHSEKSNWMRAILRKVGINLEQDSRYTQEELERLEKTLQEFEKDYKELGELGYENEYIEFS